MAGCANSFGTAAGEVIPTNSAWAASDIQIDAAGLMTAKATSAITMSTGSAKNPILQLRPVRLRFSSERLREPCMDTSTVRISTHP